MGHRHPKDEPCAVARHAQHVQGRAGSERGSSLAGRTAVSKNLNVFSETFSEAHTTLIKVNLSRRLNTAESFKLTFYNRFNRDAPTFDVLI